METNIITSFIARAANIPPLPLFLLVCILCIELYARHQLKKRKETYDFGDDDAGMDEEQYAQYYKHLQFLYVVRITFVVFLLLTLMLDVNPDSFGYLAIAAGAITLVFGSYIQSFATYFYILSITSVGQTVKVGQRQGDIIKIRPLYISLTGRSDNGEHTGELVNIPNFKVWDMSIVAMDLALNNYKKSILTICFDPSKREMSFDVFVAKLHYFLDSYLEKPSQKAIYHFKTYRGYPYKLGFDYTAHGEIEIRIGFICQLKETFEKKHAIISYVEKIHFDERKDKDKVKLKE